MRDVCLTSGLNGFVANVYLFTSVTEFLGDMYCPDCGSEISETAAFCPDCGVDIDDVTSTTQPDGTTTEPAQSTTNHGETHATQQARPSQPADAPTTQQAQVSVTSSESGLSSWPLSRLATLGGGGLAGVSLFLPWVQAIRGGYSANGMSTEFGSVVMLGVVLILLCAWVNWGRGWGRLSMLIAGVSGAGIAGVAYFFQSLVSETYTYGTMMIDGRQIPVAALEPATGVQLALLAGGVIVLSAVLGLFGSFTSS